MQLEYDDESGAQTFLLTDSSDEMHIEVILNNLPQPNPMVVSEILSPKIQNHHDPFEFIESPPPPPKIQKHHNKFAFESPPPPPRYYNPAESGYTPPTPLPPSPLISSTDSEHEREISYADPVLLQILDELKALAQPSMY